MNTVVENTVSEMRTAAAGGTRRQVSENAQPQRRKNRERKGSAERA